jgi:hypothetical protein
MGKKLTLQVEDLDVEQFQVEDAMAAERGTVHGQWESTGGCTMYCGALSNANTEPCRFCPQMPITYSCEESSCC